MKFKKVYIEITNICNMNCSFCPPHKRQNKYMNFEEFKIILEKIRPYTKYIYLHVKGEPMLHPDFDKFVEYAYNEGFFVNITTNGTLLENHLNTTKFIRQLNISLQATNDEKIIEIAKQIKDCYVNFRVWNFVNINVVDANLSNGEHTIKGNSSMLRNGEHCSPQKNPIIDLLSNQFDIDIYKKLNDTMKKKHHSTLSSETNFTLKENFYISIQNEFEWPDLAKNRSNEEGYCHALKDHIAILVDGTVIPCCLDNNGDINLGNILEEDLEKILSSSRAITMLQGFKKRKCIEELCQKCEYKNRF